MPSRNAINSTDISRDMRFWLLASAMVLGQLLAFWGLCSFQVRKAEIREAQFRAERVAVANCLRTVPDATRGSCAAHIAPLDRDAVAAAPDSGDGAQAGSPVPVNYVYQ